MSKQKEDSQVKQGNNSSTASGAITEKQREILRGCLQSIAMLNWLLTIPATTEESQLNHARLALLRFFTHTLGSQMEKLEASGVIDQERNKELYVKNDQNGYTLWLGMYRLYFAHIMTVNRLIEPMSKEKVDLLKNAMVVISKTVHGLLLDESDPVLSDLGDIPNITLLERKIGNFHYILEVVEMAEQTIPHNSSIPLSSIQTYLGLVCVELVGNNLREIRRSVGEQGLQQLGLYELYKRMSSLRNRIAHCSTIEELLDIPLIWDLKYLISQKRLFDTTNNSIVAEMPAIAMMSEPTSAAVAITSSTTTTLTTTTTTLTTTLTTMPTTALTSTSIPAGIAGVSVMAMNVLPTPQAVQSIGAQDIRQINALPVGHVDSDHMLLKSAIKKKKALLKEVRAVDKSLSALKSLNHLGIYSPPLAAGFDLLSCRLNS